MNSFVLSSLRKIMLLSVITLMIESCSKTVYPSAWQDTPVNVDGRLSEWNVPLPYYDESTRLNYAISNDKKNLYVCIRASNEETQTKMLRAGFTLWIDTTGKKNKTIGITYPLPQRMLMNHSAYTSNQQQKGESSFDKQKILSDQKQMLMTGFKNADNGLSLIGKKDGVTVAVNYDSAGVMTYEASIPFSTFRDADFSNADAIKTWSVGLEEKGLEQGQGKGNHGGGGGGGGMGGGGMGGGRGGMRGGGGRGGRGGGGGGNRSQGENSSLTEPAEVWNYIKLSSK